MPTPFIPQVDAIANGDANWGPKVKADIDAIVAQLGLALVNTYRPANGTALNALTGMRAGDLAIKVDSQWTYRYDGAAWKIYDSGWTAFTPTATGFPITAAYGRYRFAAGRVVYEFALQLSGAPSGNMQVVLPVGHDTTDGGLSDTFDQPEGTVYGKDVSDSNRKYQLIPSFVSGSGIYILLQATSGGAGALAPTAGATPFVWTNPDVVQGVVTYDPA